MPEEYLGDLTCAAMQAAQVGVGQVGQDFFNLEDADEVWSSLFSRVPWYFTLCSTMVKKSAMTTNTKCVLCARMSLAGKQFRNRSEFASPLGQRASLKTPLSKQLQSHACALTLFPDCLDNRLAAPPQYLNWSVCRIQLRTYLPMESQAASLTASLDRYSVGTVPYSPATRCFGIAELSGG